MDDPILKLESVQFSWPGQSAPTVSEDSFYLQKGEKVFLHGPSGCGKTTFLSLVAGILRPDEGRILSFGSSHTEIKGSHLDAHRADHFGIIFQLFNLLPYLSVLDNVLLPLTFSKRKTQELRRLAQSPRTEAMRLMAALDLDPELADRQITDLSVGQQQRVACARALIGSPGLLIADEPTSALDTGTRDRFLDLLCAECERNDTAVLLVSHDPSLASRFDRRLALSARKGGAES